MKSKITFFLFTENFRDEDAWKLFYERLMDGCNSTDYIFNDAFRGGRIDGKIYLKYLQAIKEVVDKKPSVAKRILKSFIPTYAKTHGIHSGEGDELLKYLLDMKNQLMDKK